ncbi:nitroreductase [Saccharopolyspora erythraea NRRL 2338]|uniref:Nitroreductase domain-containing protein n=2 Tax=Saccharopolyspora erythraea TaxID=1836 RepID=A4FCF0_SACEN|nr:nitroreductase family protein [Saccharopolyspora erythraea]EQD83897.1 nitroreductase [Saccharopolyspora erythraea D]PFG95488.1 nitroreductase [Saccharopolyspora erythraea NRRL 2338]QRK92117.1 nitroreductase family protein [Saccharopolyspora erythraea]CAM01725.1 hypothetical protein SACE_2427 [Saccharopolyspora erythraea NRRL 2338]
MSDFPSALGLSPEQTEELVRCAGAAPSLHNRQPWRFRLLPHAIELHGDMQRRLPVADPDDRELRLGCGAALLNLRLAVEHAGLRPVITLLPSLAGPSVLAEVRAPSRGTAAAADMELFMAIPARRSNRRPFRDVPVPAGHRRALVQAVREEQAWLHVVERSERGRLEGLVHRAHRAQMADPRFRSELARWTGRGEGAEEGVPASAAGPQREPQDQWVLRDFSGGQAQPRTPGKEFEHDPLMVVLCSYEDSRAADLQAGQALQRMLLSATSLGLAASLVSQVVEVEETQHELRELLGGGLRPQTVVRVGYGSPTPPTPRRDPAEMLIGSAEPANP